MNTIPAPLGVTTTPVMWDTHVDGRYAGTVIKVGSTYHVQFAQRIYADDRPPTRPTLAEAEAHITREARREGVRR